ncbi:hypothetical protein [Hymenobacter bucti]|uniref:Auto-transporter adhesin head GIN domain-containing protein n=1 Tax=Hymenobacter bucti TaxID=1844114 RepID=A0ABW4QT84_9BACT
MKNSSKFLLAAVLVLLASLTAYNMALRTEYYLGAYKDPLRGYVDLGFKNFTTVAVPASGVVGVKIVSGPFQVRLNPRAAEYVQVRQQGSQLVVTAAFPDSRRFFGPAATVLISCPHLAALTTDAVYQASGKQVVGKNFWNAEQVLVQGFRQDSLAVRADRGSRVELAGNYLGYLGAGAGPSLGSHTQLQLNADNRIAAADLTLGHQSELILNNLAIPQLKYHVADSAKVTLGGAALRSLPQK